MEMARSIVDKDGVNDPFYVLDLGVVLNLWQKWQEALPCVQPFYAVRCNRDPALLSALAVAGVSLSRRAVAAGSRAVRPGGGPRFVSRGEWCAALLLTLRRCGWRRSGSVHTATRLGLPKVSILNIGGVFTTGPAFTEMGDTVRIALKTYFPDEKAVSVICEADRYFAESALLLATKVIGKRLRGEVKEYWINDGIYGSTSCLLHGKAEPTALPLACRSHPYNISCTGLPKYRSTVYGQTCADVDTVLTNYLLPEVGVGDWLVFPNMGVYTAAASSNFNGFTTSAIQTYFAADMPS